MSYSAVVHPWCRPLPCGAVFAGRRRRHGPQADPPGTPTPALAAAVALVRLLPLVPSLRSRRATGELSGAASLGRRWQRRNLAGIRARCNVRPRYVQAIPGTFRLGWPPLGAAFIPIIVPPEVLRAREERLGDIV